MVESNQNKHICKIKFSDNPKEFKKYLRNQNYKHSVKRQRDYLKDMYELSLTVPKGDRLVLSYLRVKYAMRNGIWERKDGIPLGTGIHKNIRTSKPFPQLNSFAITILVLSYFDTYHHTVRMLMNLSHTSRAYAVGKEDDLPIWLVTYPDGIKSGQNVLS